MDNTEIVRSQLIERIQQDMKSKKASYFGAHTGWGKTTLIKQYFKITAENYIYISCADEDFDKKLRCAVKNNEENIVIDDLQDGEEVYSEITKAINESYINTRFYLLGRGSLPSFLKPYYITGIMANYEYMFFSLNTNEIETIFKNSGKEISHEAAKWLEDNSKGWLFGIKMFVKNYEPGSRLADVFEKTKYDLYAFFDERIWSRFSDDIKVFLVQIGHLSEFTVEQAQMLTGRSDVNKELRKIMTIGSFICWSPNGKYEVMELFSSYLHWKQKNEYPDSFLMRQYENTALYFALKGDITNALYYYNMADNKGKVAELLLQNAEKHAGNGYFYRLREYYFSVPDSIVETSPELMSTFSMLYSILCEPQKSEIYYNKLKEYANNAETKEQKKTAQDKIAYLNIALPHRGINGLADVLKKYAPAAISGKIKIQDMSVTGNMPGVINGGKDFGRWTKNDRKFYKLLKKPALYVLGKNYRGIMEIALGESLYYKNRDLNFTEELTLLNVGYYEAEASGNLQLQFAALGVMAQIYASTGKLDYAINTIDKFKNRIAYGEELKDNVDAFLVNFSLLEGFGSKASEWFETSAPNEESEFYIIDRYRYLTKIRIYIIKRMYSEALSLLERSDKYFLGYERTICHIEALLLRAVIMYRTHKEEWKDVFFEVLSLCRDYGFVRLISWYGIAVLDMLKDMDSFEDREYIDTLVLNTQKQAVMYPRFMNAEIELGFVMNEKEMSVLRLMCNGHTNADIASIMGTSVRTVKYCLSSIYEKLGVKGRAGAVNMCLKNKII